MANQLDKDLWKNSVPATVTANGGTFTLTLHLTGGDQTTGTVNFNDVTATLQSTLDGLIGAGNSLVTALNGTDLRDGFTITYIGTNANTHFTTMTVTPTGMTSQASAGGLSEQTAGVLGQVTLDGTPDIGGGEIFFTLRDSGNNQILGAAGGITGNDSADAAALQASSDTSFPGIGTWQVSGSIVTATFNAGKQTALIDISLSTASGATNTLNLVSAGAFEVYSYYQSPDATGGTFNLTHTGSGSDVTGIVYNVDHDTLATNLSTATGATFTFTSGLGTQVSPWLFTCSTPGPVTVPAADFGPLTRDVSADTSTVTPGGSAPAVSNQGSCLVGAALSIWG